MLREKYKFGQVIQNKLTNDRYKQLARYLIAIVDHPLNAHRLQLVKSTQRTEQMIANSLFIPHIKAFDITHLFNQ